MNRYCNRKRFITKAILMLMMVVPLLMSSSLVSFSGTNDSNIAEATNTLKSIHCGSDYFYYNDQMLLKNIGATTASGELSLASVGMAVAAYDQSSISDTLTSMGFETLFKSEYYNKKTTHDSNDVVAYSIAEKYVSYNGKTYRIMIVPIRGTPQTCEWYSDFNIGSGNQHKGFYTAARAVLAQISNYAFEPSHDVDHTIIWTMGHSRGAAVANIVAGEISTDNAWKSLTSKDYVFGYTYACPAVSTTADTSLHNIFNYNNGGDVVPAMPLSDWGFKRFGQTLELPASDYENLCQRFKAETGDDYAVGMTTVAYEQILKNLAQTQNDFVTNDKIQLGVDMLSWFLGGKDDSSYKLLNVVLAHPSANAEMVGSVIKTTLFPKSTLEAMTADLTAADLQLMFDSDLREYLELETDLTTAISDTAEMSDVDSEDEENHKKYLEWLSWKSSHSGLISQVKDMTNVEIKNKADLYTARTAAGERYEDYNDIVSTIRDVLSLIYDTNGNLGAPFTQGHPQNTYLLWVNSMYYGYKGWYGNSSITRVNWNGRSQKSYVGDVCFKECSKLKTVNNTPSKILIGDSAFSKCTALTEAEFEGDGITIGSSTFRGCSSLTDIGFTGAGITVGESAFSDCISLVNLTIPDDIKYVNSRAFDDCTSLKNLTTPLGGGRYYYGSSYCSFDGCSGLKNITITKGADGEYFDDDGFSYAPWETVKSKIEHITIAEGVKSLNNGMFSGSGNVKVVELPSTLERIKAAGSGTSASPTFGTCKEKVIYHGTLASWCGIDFGDENANPLARNGCALYIGDNQVTDLVIPSGITEVKKYTFCKCAGLTSVTVPKSITAIGVSAFRECNEISAVEIKGTTSIGDSAFSKCTALTEAEFEGDGITIGSSTFRGCSSLTDIGFTGAGITVGESAFSDCISLVNLTIPDDIKYVNSRAFDDCTSLKNLTTPLGGGRYYYGSSYCSFDGCSGLKNITITKGADGEYFDDDGFSYAPWETVKSKIEHITIAEGVKSLNNGMFSGSGNVKVVELPSTLERIKAAGSGTSASPTFGTCKEKVIYHGTLASWCGIDFGDENANPLARNGCALYIGDNQVTDLVIPSGITEVKKYTFCKCAGLTSVTVPKSITAIGVSAFRECNEISAVEIKGTTSIGDSAFSKCTALTEAEFEGDGITIGSSTFRGCSSLTDIGFTGAGITVGESAFSDCISLVNLTIPDDIKYVNSRAFDDCTSLKNLTTPLGGGRYYYGSSYCSFDGCSGLKNITITKGADGEYFDDDGFSYAPWETVKSKIEHITIAEGVKSLNNGMFSGSGNVKVVELPSTLERIKAAGSGTSASPTFGTCKEKVIYHGTLASWCGIDFGDENANPLARNGCALYIGDNQVTDLVIPSGITEVKKYTFCKCAGLASVNVPKGVTAIGVSAFNDCTGITDVYYAGTENEWKAIDIKSGNDPLINAIIHYNGDSQIIAVKGINLDVTEKTLSVEDTFTITPTIDPEDATNKNVSWESSATGIADVDAEGLVTAVSTGEATITATTEDGGFTATCKVTVTSSEGHQHDLQKTDAVEAECEKAGNSAYWTCATCGKYFSDEDGTVEIDEGEWVIEALDHEWNNDWKPVEGKDATCMEKGQEYDTCSRDPSHIRYRDTALANHTMTHVAASDATCTANGNYEYWHCSVCEKFFSDKDGAVEIGEAATIIPAAHSWNKFYTTDKEATCKEEGSESIHCAKCTATMDSRSVAKAAHSFGAWTVATPATVDHAGESKRSCSVCGYTETQTIAKLKSAPSVNTSVVSEPAPTVAVAAKISKPKAAKGAITVRWKKANKKNQKKISGYQIQIATDSNFANIVKTANAGKKASSKKIKGLAKKTTYYVRVRAYKGGAVGAWSGVKRTKTK